MPQWAAKALGRGEGREVMPQGACRPRAGKYVAAARAGRRAGGLAHGDAHL